MHNITWDEECDDEVCVVREPGHGKQDHHDKTHLDNLALLLLGSGDGWLSDGAVTELEQSLSASP